MEELKNQIVNFLKEYSSCDCRCTKFPYYWTIADERETYEKDPYGEYIWDSNGEGILPLEDLVNEYFDEFTRDFDADDLTKEGLIDEIHDPYSEDYLDNFIEWYLDGAEVERFSLSYETYYEGMFLTQKDAEEYLESCMNHHFGPNPRTYLQSFNEWGRTSRTETFIKNLFKYFNVPEPPELYYQNKEEK